MCLCVCRYLSKRQHHWRQTTSLTKTARCHPVIQLSHTHPGIHKFLIWSIASDPYLTPGHSYSAAQDSVGLPNFYICMFHLSQITHSSPLMFVLITVTMDITQVSGLPLTPDPTWCPKCTSVNPPWYSRWLKFTAFPHYLMWKHLKRRPN